MLPSIESPVSINALEEVILSFLTVRLDQAALTWLSHKQGLIKDGASERVLFTAFSSVPRYLGKADLTLGTEEQAAIAAQCPEIDLGTWSVDQAGRTLLLLALPSDDLTAYTQTLSKLFQAADVGEQVALYQAFPCLPHPLVHQHQATEGVRSNITSVFQAIVLRNPYPANYFDENAWNQLVLKSLFVDSPLYPIVGFDRRANATLARMLVDYTHERWAAGRTFNPEIWRAIGPFAQGSMVGDLARALDSDDLKQRQAAALAASQSPDAKAQPLLSNHGELKDAIQFGGLTWERFSQQLAAAA